MKKIKVMPIFGTRPEAIKMAPLVKALESREEFDVRVCVTAQHRQMLDQVLHLFKIEPSFDLNLMKTNQSLADLSAAVLINVGQTLKKWRPDLVLVHGDTTTTIASSMAAFYDQIKIGHVEAGLRTGNLKAPWPEEFNRKATGIIADFHFAPTEKAKANLLREEVNSENIFVTGNTVIDAVIQTTESIKTDKILSESLKSRFSFLSPDKRLLLVTGHRRENFGSGFENICEAISSISERDDVEVVYPVHLNPNVQEPVKRILGSRKNVHLIAPLDYLPFVYLMGRSYLILTDSGGIQEEAPAIGKPVLVMRETTERPEAVDAGTVRLVGTSVAKIVEGVERLLTDEHEYSRMASASNPFGDGTASRRIVHHIINRAI